MLKMILTITSGKGGVGKSTSVGNLGIALARRGKRVVCVDMDIGLRNLDLVLGLENRIVYNLMDVLEGKVKLKQALVQMRHLRNLYLLPAPQWYAPEGTSRSTWKKLFDDLAIEFDYVLIDCPAGIEEGFHNSIAPADEILLVTTPDVSSIRDADRVVRLARSAGKKPVFLVVNRVRPAMIRKGDMLQLEQISELLGIVVFGVVPEDEKIIAATNAGEPVAFDSRSLAGAAIDRIARRILGEDVPVMRYGHTPWIDRFSTVFHGT